MNEAMYYVIRAPSRTANWYWGGQPYKVGWTLLKYAIHYKTEDGARRTIAKLESKGFGMSHMNVVAIDEAEGTP